MTSGGRWSGITFGFPFLCLFYPETHRRCLRSSCGLLLLLLWQEFFRKEASLVTQEVKEPLAMQETQKTWVPSLGQEDPLEEGMAIHSSMLAWRISRTEEPGGLQSMGSQRVGHD